MSLDGSVVAVVGSGNGAQAFAGSLAARGHTVRMLTRSPDFVHRLGPSGIIRCHGVENCDGRVAVVSTAPDQVIPGAGIVIICTTADAHEAVVQSVAPFLDDGQILLLSPGRTGGALVARQVLTRRHVSAAVVVAEAQSLVYACRSSSAGDVCLIGIKKDVPVGFLGSSQCPSALARIRQLYPAFSAAQSVLETSLGNIGAILHPAIVIAKASAVESGEAFLFYRDLTPEVADLVLQVDAERVALEKAFGLRPLGLIEWMDRAYPECRGEGLLDRMFSNPAYATIAAPTRLDSRYLTEDIPTGLVQMVCLGEVVGLRMPLMRGLIQKGGDLLGKDFWEGGRTLKKLGLDGMSRDAIISAFG